MNASPQSPPQKHHPHLERGALTLLTLASLFAIWLGIGLPGLPPVAGGSAEAGGRDTLVAHLDAAAPRRHEAPPQRLHSRRRAPSRHAHEAVRSTRANALPVARTPSAPTPKQTAAAQASQPTPVTPTAVAPTPHAAPKAPAAPTPAAAPSPSPAPTPPAGSEPVQTTVDVVQQAVGELQTTVGDATAAVPSGSDVQQTAQNAVSTVTNAVPPLPTLP